ncbi:ABC transporter substrate-binding protein [Derxia lacustris]|uniref:ABC transporter substrate-binding protein n=1 Tax=Derxia lacustris TaxID=764842 RepID=UPI000A17088B|nr:ABC transporter substrate-binding protein [Derxia lacustris]
MTTPRRSFLSRLTTVAAACALAAGIVPAAHADTPVKFQLDWRFEGPSALFLLPAAKGYFKAEGLDVTVDAGNGSGNAVNRVASGAYDMGFADLAALMEFVANNPTAPSKPVAVMMVYNNTPAAVLALKKSGIKSPADLTGKKLGAPVFDAGRRAFPIFAKANKVGAVEWIGVDPALRETMLAKGDLDAITGFSFTSQLNLNARGIKDADIVVMPYPDYGVKLYGNAIIVSEKFLKEHPDAVKGFLRAFTKGVKEVIANPEAAIAVVKQRDGIIDSAMETRRLKLALSATVLTPDAKAEGFGDVNAARLSLMGSQVSDAFATKSRVDAGAVWNASFLPPAAERNLFSAK